MNRTSQTRRGGGGEGGGGATRGTLALAGVVVLSACASGPERDIVQLHAAFGTADDVVVEGRVLEDVPAALEADAADHPRVNLRRNAALFTSDECDECPVGIALGTTPPVRTVTDDDGFFRVEIDPRGADTVTAEAFVAEPVPAAPLATDAAGVEAAPDAGGPRAAGWRPLVATSGAIERRGHALVVPPGNRLGIVSDVDDTVLVTEVGDRYRMLGNTFLKNPLQRDAVEGVAALYARVLARNPHPEAAPMFYLSSSPRQLNDYLLAFLARNELPRGVLITRRLTLDPGDGFGEIDSVAYKTDRLVEILERLPDVTFVLVGDDGENDPTIYADVRERYPGRIAAIWIRRANPDAAALPAGQERLADVLAGRVPLPTLEPGTPLSSASLGR